MKDWTLKTIGLAAIAIVVLAGISACTDSSESAAEEETGMTPLETPGAAMTSEGGEQGEEGGEHMEGGEGEEGGEHAEGAEGEEGEESGEYVARDATWDNTRRGMRLVLALDASSNAFVGTVENTTQAQICAVRVEVHLSGGPELGPTNSTDLPPGESVSVELPAGSNTVETWTAHPESSACGGTPLADS